MRRVTIATGIFPPDIGGPATSVPLLAAGLRERGFEVSVVTLAERAEPSASDEVHVERIPRSLPFPRRVWAVRRALAAAGPDVILANGLHTEATLATRVPVVGKVVGDWAWERARNRGWTTRSIEAFQQGRLDARSAGMRRLRTTVARRLQSVVVPSAFLAELVRGWGVSDVHVVPNAAPPVDSAPLAAERPQRALFVGRLVSWKRLDDVVRVLPRLPELELDIAGDGPEEARLRSLAGELGVAARVRFLGTRPRESVDRLMREAGFLVLPSSYEGMPHVVLEAWSAGLPVVASDAAGTAELVSAGSTGLLYPVGDLDRLAEAVRAVRTDGAALAEAGRHAAEAFTLERSVAATAQVLEEAARG